MSKAATGYATAPSRVQFQYKDPRGWKEFADQLAGNSTRGSALTMRGVQKRRPSLFDFLHAVDVGRWPVQDPRAMANAILGK